MGADALRLVALAWCALPQIAAQNTHVEDLVLDGAMFDGTPAPGREGVLGGQRLTIPEGIPVDGSRMPPLSAEQVENGAADKATLLEAKAAADTSLCTGASCCKFDACPLDTWIPETQPCNDGYDDYRFGWVGVVCDGRGGRVVAVRLVAANVGGDMMPSFGRLDALQSLDLSFNPTLREQGLKALLGGVTKLRTRSGSLKLGHRERKWTEKEIVGALRGGSEMAILRLRGGV